MHLLQNSTDNRGVVTLCDIRSLYNCAQEYYQVISTEAISEKDWLINNTTLTMITMFQLVE